MRAWYEAYADLAGERTKLYVFVMRSMASGAAFHCAFTNATQQAFLEAHELAFAWFGGVFRRLRYDNLSAAVTRHVRDSLRGVAFSMLLVNEVLKIRPRQIAEPPLAESRQNMLGRKAGNHPTRCQFANGQ